MRLSSVETAGNEITATTCSLRNQGQLLSAGRNRAVKTTTSRFFWGEGMQRSDRTVMFRDDTARLRLEAAQTKQQRISQPLVVCNDTGTGPDIRVFPLVPVHTASY